MLALQPRRFPAKVSSVSAQFIISRPLTPLVYGSRIKKAYSQDAEKGTQAAVRALNIQLEMVGPRESDAACRSFISRRWLAVKQIMYSWAGSNVAAENSRSSRRWRAVSVGTHFVPNNSSVMRHVAVPEFFFFFFWKQTVILKDITSFPVGGRAGNVELKYHCGWNIWLLEQNPELSATLTRHKHALSRVFIPVNSVL